LLLHRVSIARNPTALTAVTQPYCGTVREYSAPAENHQWKDQHPA